MMSDDSMPDLDDSYFDIYSTKTITNTYYGFLKKLTSGNNASGNRAVVEERDREENHPGTSMDTSENRGNLNEPCTSKDTDRDSIILDDASTSAESQGGGSIISEDSNGSAISVSDDPTVNESSSGRSSVNNSGSNSDTDSSNNNNDSSSNNNNNDNSSSSSSSAPVSEDDSDVEVIHDDSNICTPSTPSTPFTRIRMRRGTGRRRRGRGRGRGTPARRGRGRGRGRGAQQMPVVEVIADSPVPKRRRTQSPEVVELSDDEPAEQMNQTLEEDFNYEVSVKILWMSVTVKTFHLRKFQKFTSIFEHFMKEENLPYENILLKLGNVRITKNDTPDSLNLKVCDFIDGGILSEAKKPEVIEKVNNDKNCLTIKLQDKTKFSYKLTINKGDKFKLLMVKYSEQTEIPLKNLKFYYDGELVNPSDTPSSLGISNDEIIDVKY